MSRLCRSAQLILVYEGITMHLGRLALLSIRFALICPMIAAPASSASAATHGHHASSSAKPSARHAVKPKLIGQRGIDSGRATEIQAALIKSGYLSGQPSGNWDAQTEAAMQKLQGDNGWQTKLVPDSRAIIKLGLGPAADSPLIASGTSASPAAN